MISVRTLIHIQYSHSTGGAMKFLVSCHHRHLQGCGVIDWFWFQFLLICITALTHHLPDSFTIYLIYLIHGGLIQGNPFVFVSHQTTAWLRRRLGHAAVPFLAGITTLHQRSVRNSSSVAAGRTSTTILARLSAPAPALTQVLDKGFYTGFFHLSPIFFLLFLEHVSRWSNLKRHHLFHDEY